MVVQATCQMPACLDVPKRRVILQAPPGTPDLLSGPRDLCATHAGALLFPAVMDIFSILAVTVVDGGPVVPAASPRPA